MSRKNMQQRPIPSRPIRTVMRSSEQDFLSIGDLFNSVVGNVTNVARRFPIDVVNTENKMDIYAEIPGVKKDRIIVDFYNNRLTISRDKERPYSDPDTSEIYYGNITRVVILPICVTKKEAVEISYKDGILHISINKLLEEENKFSVSPTD